MSVSSLVATSSSDVSNLSEINAKGAMDLSNISSKLNEDKDILLRSIQGISKGVEDQAITASNIAQNINKIAKSIETFGDKLKVVTDILQETNIKIKDMNKEAYEKIPIVDEIVNAMSSVTDIFNNIKTNSEKIRSAFVPIQTIANQNQLWSSNAIIETAKLGDQWKGFEVIIEEIRNLSEKLLNTTNDILINLSEGFNSSDGSKINFNKQDENIDIIKKYFSSIENSAIVLANNVNDLSTKIEKIKEDASGLLSSKDIKNIETSLTNLAALAEEDLSNIHEINRASLDVQRAIENVAEISKDGVSSTKNISEKANEQLTEANKMEEVSNVIKIKSNGLEDEVRKFKI
jgi:methyl-accepting chemotaxis protein